MIAPSRRVVLSAAALSATALLTGAGPTVAAPRARMSLPAPTGPYDVGTVGVRLVDRGRRDPWGTRAYRELMVGVRYPARSVRGYESAPQMTPAAAQAYDRMNGLVEPGRVDWAATRSHAYTHAPVARPARPAGFPVVLYSPGAGDPRTLGTTLCDELASRGYVVVMLDHTYDAQVVEFPRRRLERTVLPREFTRAKDAGPEHVVALLKRVVDVRVADTRFVLDQLCQLPGPLGRLLDLGAVGMFGQSAGGFTAAQTMHDDRRIRAALNMDGVMGYTERDDDPANPSPVGTDGVDRPLLLMGMDGDDHHTVASWGAVWEHSTGWRRDLTLTGTAHASFTDLQSQVPQIARQLGLPDDFVAKSVGRVDPVRSVAAQKAYVCAFFDRWLRGRDDAGLLERPSARWPEVRFVE
ncbi:hydrolase [Streptomyces sp. TLI_146]|uniref:alpha/beta hydrolase family protein n=1 Tax=Streptomyces sp. TLI_146 TaxID=1938858 RepID=UPI000C6FD5FA|nr:hydrolase [Streptomyces sp. TLI_146]PKV86429.1 platelet-activating factor acetylhydrolase isoform II [Streptomyces sp. TLI_146]